MAIQDSDMEAALVAAARAVAGQAYAPYSRFAVGAALRADDGRVFCGCNVENASFGLTICAERVALFHAVAQGARRFRALAIYTPTSRPTPPCGACRQALKEFCDDLDILCLCDGAETARFRLADLLPHTFGL